MFYGGGFQSSNHLYHKSATEIPSMSIVTQRFCFNPAWTGLFKGSTRPVRVLFSPNNARVMKPVMCINELNTNLMISKKYLMRPVGFNGVTKMLLMC